MLSKEYIMERANVWFHIVVSEQESEEKTKFLNLFKESHLGQISIGRKSSVRETLIALLLDNDKVDIIFEDEWITEDGFADKYIEKQYRQDPSLDFRQVKMRAYQAECKDIAKIFVDFLETTLQK